MAGRPSVFSSSQPRIRSTAGDSYDEQPLGVNDRDHVRGALHEGSEPLLALAHGFRLRRRQTLCLDHVCLVQRHLPDAAEQLGHELADQDEEDAAAHPVAEGLGRIGGDVSGQQRPRDERRDDRGHESPRRPETQAGEEHRNVEPVGRDDGPAAEEIGRTPAGDEQPSDDRQRRRRGQVRQGGPADHAEREGLLSSLDPLIHTGQLSTLPLPDLIARC